MVIFQHCWRILTNFWLKVDSFGLTTDMSYLEDRRVRMVNLIAAWSFICALFYSIVNLVTDILILTAVDLTYCVLVLFVFYFHHRKRFKLARIYLSVITILFLGTISYFFYHIAEYYLFCVLIAGILVFHDKQTHVLISISLVLAILIPKAFFSDFSPVDPLPQARLLFNLPLAVFLIFFMVRHFKHIQQNYQDEIKKQQQHLEVLNRDKEQLFAIIAHDIRSPLVATSQILQHVSNEVTSEEFRKQSLLQVTSQLRVMTENVDNLLHWSSQNLQGLISRPVSFNLHTLLLDVLKSMEAQRKAKRIQTVIDVPVDIYVFADSEQIHIVLRNILSNAFKFSHKQGEVKISAKKADAAIKIAIEDWGVGMSKKKVKKLFNNLQLPSYGTSGERGTGLGLVLVNNLIQINRGEIKVSSVENAGTTILLKFPAVESL
ncbi:sensor histidine kinase [Sphingobacterium paludis]|uniref:histidine kinase n=1 Tax=Sphingobacterium paludis TaxID=1476465 RepID=A0A4V3E152_9SPHI|nr:HAMP domain-containing sensor histidine kinase [Sphingobacterium paludis]TDS11688.1 signal transduction histidine kinase [Sphingobacterium paludis]